MMDDLKRYEELVKTIEYHNDRYYNQDDPEISDYDYDMMMKELKKIEKDHPEYVTPNSPTQHVGGSAKMRSRCFGKTSCTDAFFTRCFF